VKAADSLRCESLRYPAAPTPRLRHFCEQGHDHYLTVNTYRRDRIFDSERFKRKFVQTVDDLWTTCAEQPLLRVAYIHDNVCATQRVRLTSGWKLGFLQAFGSLKLATFL